MPLLAQISLCGVPYAPHFGGPMPLIGLGKVLTLPETSLMPHILTPKIGTSVRHKGHFWLIFWLKIYPKLPLLLVFCHFWFKSA